MVVSVYREEGEAKRITEGALVGCMVKTSEPSIRSLLMPTRQASSPKQHIAFARSDEVVQIGLASLEDNTVPMFP